MTVQEFFDALPSKVDPAKTAGMNNSFVVRHRRRRRLDRDRRRRRRLGRRG